jgi:predicted esterase
MDSIRRCFLLCLGLLAMSLPVLADELIVIPTRDGVTSSYWWMPRDNARANLILLSGGSGGIGYRNGTPQSNNFLIRSREHFATGDPHGRFNVALLGNASDIRQLDPSLRATPEHVADIAAVVAHIRAGSPLPIWLVGTSQGTISAAAAAISLRDKVNGVVLSASMTSFKTPTSVPRLAIDQIRLPVLVISHEQDSCKVTLPSDGKYIMEKLLQAPIKKWILLAGGSNPVGNECEALHWHGFINMEAKAAQTIASWILNPQL